MNVDAIRPAPLLPPGSLLEDGEHTLLPVSLQSFFPYLVCVELDNSLGFGRKISLNTQWKLKRRIFSSGLPISSGVFFNEKIKDFFKGCNKTNTGVKRHWLCAYFFITP